MLLITFACHIISQVPGMVTCDFLMQMVSFSCVININWTKIILS